MVLMPAHQNFEVGAAKTLTRFGLGGLLTGPIQSKEQQCFQLTMLNKQIGRQSMCSQLKLVRNGALENAYKKALLSIIHHTSTERQPRVRVSLVK